MDAFALDLRGADLVRAGINDLRRRAGYSERVARGHRTAELRSIALHGLVAERIEHDPAVLEGARARVERWLETGEVHPLWAARWRELLDRPRDELLDALVADTEEMRDLRQVTPFAGVVSPRERWQVVRDVR
jgi:hypothetical protein